MPYKRASKKQLAAIVYLSGVLGVDPPFWYERYSATEAQQAIASLNRRIKLKSAADEAARQTTLL